jgi:hypothetical protein
VATAGIVLAYIFITPGTATPLPPGTLLTPTSGPISGQWGLRSANPGDVVVAQLATPVSNPGAQSSTLQPALVWVVPPVNSLPFV